MTLRRPGTIAFASAVLVVLVLVACFLYIERGLHVSRYYTSPLYDLLRAESELNNLVTAIESFKRKGEAIEVMVASDIVLSRLDGHPLRYTDYSDGIPAESMEDVAAIISVVENIQSHFDQPDEKVDIAQIDTLIIHAGQMLTDLKNQTFLKDFVIGRRVEVQSLQMKRIVLALTFVAMLLGVFISVRLWTQRNQIMLNQDRLERALNQREKELLHMQRMEAMGQMTAGVAHDFNNLLAVILGNAELLLKTSLSKESQDSLRAIADATERGKRLNQQLLLFSGRTEFAAEILNLNEVIRDLDQLVRRTFSENVRIDTVLAGGLGRIKADRALVESTLMNLVVNAYEQLESGGVITIETANVRLDEIYVFQNGVGLQPGRYVMVAVSDTGGGIAPDLEDKIFEPFFSTKERGSGLGLSTAYGFVRKSGGAIRVYSEPGKGTTFKIYFPLSIEDVAKEATINTADIADEAAKPATILVVEDNEQLRTTLIRQLHALDYICVDAANAAQALDILKDIGAIDLMLTDLVMPGKMQGPELVKYVAKKYPDMKTIIMSGYPKNAAENGNGELSGVTKLMKPVSLAHLEQAIRQEFERSKAGEK